MENSNIVHEFSQLRVLTPSTIKKKMDALVHDLNTALEESTSGSRPSTSRRKAAWRRRCKSTSNLAVHTLVAAASDDSSSSVDNYGLVSRGDKGTSSLQLSDSDDGLPARRGEGHPGSDKGSHSSRKKQREHYRTIGIESDSVNENFSPITRPNTKRKRKFKRMALDPGTPQALPSAVPTNVTKRKKVRTRSGCDVSNGSGIGRGMIIPGKRKRKDREKSVETDHLPHQIKSDHAQDRMDCDGNTDDKRSSSSLSSSEWEDVESVEPVELDRGREADDEQSDWPGHEAGSFALTDDEVDGASTAAMASLSRLTESHSNPAGLSALFAGSNLQNMTHTAKQAYLARMKRLAECVPGREIRAGSRRVRNRQVGFTIKSSSSEQLSRFLQDPTRSELKLTVLRTADRNKIMHLANLYSLSYATEGSTNLILSKTGKTVKVDEFVVPGTPAKNPMIEIKRRRRSPPNSPLLEGSSASNEPPVSPEGPDVAMDLPETSDNFSRKFRQSSGSQSN